MGSSSAREGAKLASSQEAGPNRLSTGTMSEESSNQLELRYADERN